MVNSAPRFSDITSHWARPFIESLAQRGLLSGFGDRTFRPNESMTRAQFAAVVSRAFPLPRQRPAITFRDVPSNHWAAAAIQQAYEMGFISGFPDRTFRPDDRITRLQIILSLTNGLGITDDFPGLSFNLATLYQDAAQIPDYAQNVVRAATQAELVSSFPNVKLLNPNLAATRADVAVFIYQALVYTQKAPALASPYLVVPPLRQVAVGHRREFRGVWVASVWNLDFPSRRGLTADQLKTEFLTLLDTVQTSGMNALVLQVRPEGDALYVSNLEPWSVWLTGTPGQSPGFDPLEFAIAECHKRNIEFHAWFNPYRAKSSLTQTPANVAPHIAVTNPDFVYTYGNQQWTDPGIKTVYDRTYQVVLDVVKRYNVDGIHLDDYFYPYPITNQPFPDNKTYAAYQAGGGKLSLGDWRRENVNQLVKRLYQGIHATKPQVKFGISPFGIYRPGQPEGIRGLDAYDQLYADAKKWLEQGWVDYFSPQLYWRIDQTAQSYPVLLKWWAENNPQKRHLYVGNNIRQLDGKAWTLEEITKQIDITRNLRSQLALGNLFYSVRSLQENRQGIREQFKTTTYAKPVLPPVMDWLATTPTAPPTEFTLRNGQLNWNAAPANIRAWTLYQQQGSNWELQRIFPASTTSTTVTPGVYALCAVDRLWQESIGVIARTQ